MQRELDEPGREKRNRRIQRRVVSRSFAVSSTRLYLVRSPYISPISPLYLPYISRACRTPSGAISLDLRRGGWRLALTNPDEVSSTLAG